MILTKFAKFVWGVLFYNLLVILWGAYVRATGSGAGCGSHWPLCNGEVIPRSPQAETMIEFTHRLMSGLSLVLIIVLLIWAFRAYSRGHIVRKGAVLSLVFIITEALIGAGLVLFEWVAQDASTGRAIAMTVHLANTFILLAFITLTAWWASGGDAPQLHGNRNIIVLLVIGWLGMLILGMSGALTALGDTLFPVATLEQGLSQDFSPTAHFLIRLRLFHPSIAIIVGIYLIIVASYLRNARPDEGIRSLSLAITLLFIIQLAAGILNVLLLAPVWLQLVHLLLADLSWIALVLLSAAILATQKVDYTISEINNLDLVTNLQEEFPPPTV
jgi:heme A synthase